MKNEGWRAYLKEGHPLRPAEVIAGGNGDLKNEAEKEMDEYQLWYWDADGEGG